jgi:hypothetical protein
MTSLKQIDANRRNASNSTGPRTDTGKRRSRRNALRHGLTAETVINGLEDSRDYRSFQQAIASEFEAQTAVERELVLRLASLMWRLRRALSVETGLFEIQSQNLSDAQADQSGEAPPLYKIRPAPSSYSNGIAAPCAFNDISAECMRQTMSRAAKPIDLARCFLGLSTFDDGALDRLSRYETGLWRQIGQTLFLLEMCGFRSKKITLRSSSRLFSRYAGR